jgi:hypothetical protein
VVVLEEVCIRLSSEKADDKLVSKAARARDGG